MQNRQTEIRQRVHCVQEGKVMGIMWEMEKATEMLQTHDMETIAGYMDTEIRENLHRIYAPCNEVYFLAMYITEHECKYGEEFTII